MIVCDGGNGAGKSTVLRAIEEHLVARGCAPVMTREPGGTPIGERIRELLLDPQASGMCDVTELLLFAAARAQHVREKIRPAIAAGKVVVSDRFDSATVSFQHYARGLPLALITQLNAIAVDGLRPDQTIILDLDPLTGLQRVGARGTAPDRLEQEKLEFLHRARNGYLAQAQADPAHFEVIDAARPLAEVIAATLAVVERVLTRHGQLAAQGGCPQR